MKDKRLSKYFKIACYAECLSCVLLFLIAMPLKYIFNNEYFMPFIGSIHGVFFSIYLILTIYVRDIYQWDDEDFVLAILAAFFPFATLWVEKSLAKVNRE